MADHEIEAPPLGEDVHMPGPSIVPLLNAVGIALCLLALTTTWILAAFGGPLFVWTLIRWVIDVRRDVDALPLEHH